MRWDPGMIDPESDRPLYKQVADLVRDAIESGRLQPGEVIPSQKRMAQTLGISEVPTVRAAYRILVADGLIETGRGKVPRVRSRSDLAIVLDELRTAVADLVRRPSAAGVDRVVGIAAEARRLVDPEDPPTPSSAL